jgi:ABC-type amino acid transport substrate-binding protein
MRRFVVAFLVLSAVFLGAARASAGPKLVVGTHPVPPFVVKGDDGSWSGISIDLWRRVAEKAGLEYEIREYPVEQLLAPDPAIDVVCSLNVTAQAEQKMDLTHAFYSTGLTIAVVPAPAGVIATLKQVFTKGFLGTIGLTLVVLVFFGGLMWVAERRKNEAQFGGNVLQGLGNGFWWSAVTMTTVGYGDKSPVTLVGRFIALLWMFGGVFAISMFTASISSALTVNQLESGIRGPQDLGKARIGTVDPSGGSRYLKARHLGYKGYNNATEALGALKRKEVDAVVYEAPILQYLVRTEFEGVTVLDGTFDNHGYAFGLRTGSPLREKINLALLEIASSDAFAKLLAQYVGSST